MDRYKAIMKELYALENGTIRSINQPSPQSLFVLLANQKEKVEIAFEMPLEVKYKKGSFITKVIQKDNLFQFLDNDNLIILQITAKSAKVSRP